MSKQVEPECSSSKPELERGFDRELAEIARRLRELRKDHLKLKQSELAEKLRLKAFKARAFGERESAPGARLLEAHA